MRFQAGNCCINLRICETVVPSIPKTVYYYLKDLDKGDGFLPGDLVVRQPTRAIFWEVEHGFPHLHCTTDRAMIVKFNVQLVLSIGTVKTHVHNIFGKLGVRDRPQAIAHATKLGLVKNG
jgi:hypothetical protein